MNTPKLWSELQPWVEKSSDSWKSKALDVISTLSVTHNLANLPINCSVVTNHSLLIDYKGSYPLKPFQIYIENNLAQFFFYYNAYPLYCDWDINNVTIPEILREYAECSTSKFALGYYSNNPEGSYDFGQLLFESPLEEDLQSYVKFSPPLEVDSDLTADSYVFTASWGSKIAEIITDSDLVTRYPWFSSGNTFYMFFPDKGYFYFAMKELSIELAPLRNFMVYFALATP